jgi:hypothetical protein
MLVHVNDEEKNSRLIGMSRFDAASRYHHLDLCLLFCRHLRNMNTITLQL